MRNYLTLFIALVFTCSLNAQNTLLVYTKFPTHLNFVDGDNHAIPVKSIWNHADGGLMLSFSKLDDTYVVADELVNFKLSDQNRLTKLIALDSENKISLHKCFTSEKYCCEKLTDKQKKGTEKLLAVSVMKKSAAANSPLVFSDKNLTQVQNLADLSVKWKTAESIKEVYLVDISSLETVWQSSEFTSSEFNYSDLKLQNVNLNKNHKYQLNVLLNTVNPEAGKFTFEFDYTELAFAQSDYHFATTQAIKIDWKTEASVSKLKLVDFQQNVIWESDNPGKSTFDISMLGDEASKVVVGKEYSLLLELEDKNKYEYQFMVLLDGNESDELRELLNF